MMRNKPIAINNMALPIRFVASCKVCFFSRPSIDHYAFHTSVIVLVYMMAGFLLFSNTAQRVVHPGQDWVFKNTDSLIGLFKRVIDKFVSCLNSQLQIVLTSQ